MSHAYLQVLQLLANYNIVSAPIFKAGTDTCLGFLDLNDVLAAILAWFSKHNVPDGDRLAKLQKAGVLDVQWSIAERQVQGQHVSAGRQTTRFTGLCGPTHVRASGLIHVCRSCS